MATVFNRSQAFERAAYKAKHDSSPYAIYKHRLEPDFIVRPAMAPGPNASSWDHIATIAANGKTIFNAE